MLTTNHTTKEALKQQLKEWHLSNYMKDITTIDVYKFLSGDTSVFPSIFLNEPLVIFLLGFDWMRYFGMDLWYLSKPNLTVSEIVRDFHQTKLKQSPTSYKTAVSIFANADKDKSSKECMII